jgi:uncharacterized protein
MASTLNLATLKTPGVYIDEVSLFPPSVAQVETAIPAFIGYTEIAQNKVPNDLINKPKRITSLLEYEQYFGKAPKEGVSITVDIKQTAVGGVFGASVNATINETTRSPHILYYAMQLFYGNGGGDCYIVSVGPQAGTVTLGASTGTGLRRGLEEISKVDEPTLILFPESSKLSDTDYKSLHSDALLFCENLKDRFVVMDAMSDATETATAAATDFRDNRSGSNNLKYGAAYTPFLMTNIDFLYDEALVEVDHKLDGVASIYDAAKMSGITDMVLKSKAILAVIDLVNILPPSPAVVGTYAAVDNQRGVWKAPANVGLNNVVAPTYFITDKEQENLNVDATSGKSINAIRSFTGKGTLIWGARTLAGNDNEWKYVSVRRFFNMVEESIKKASAQFVFEPNDANTWVKVRAMIENFLTLQWRAGALAGAKPEHAFFVSVGLGKTMTAQDILNGIMIVEIGMAVVRPAEFIVLRFSHKMQES